MKELIEAINKLKNSKVKEIVDARIKEFKEIGNKSNIEIFKELCFCILTANFNAERSIKIQREIGDGFLTFPEVTLAKKLKDLGHRYYDVRAKYIVEARKYANSLKETINSFNDENKLREWLVENIKGLGYKEASHFLRNIGYTNFAILDFHIIDLLAKYGLIEKPKTLTKKKYLEIEKILKEIAEKLNMNLAELDLYLWYLSTGKILK
ncbi:MAG: N-glycosylase/DNA lyase [Nitrososphaerota archaeon]